MEPQQSMTFNELFWSIWNKNNYDLPIEQNITYIFEMTSPLTQVLIPRTTNDIHLIGARNLNTMKEIFHLFSPGSIVKINRYHIQKCCRFNDTCQQG